MWFGKPFEDRAMAAKSLKEVMVEKKNWIHTTCLQFIVNFPPSLLKQFEL